MDDMDDMDGLRTGRGHRVVFGLVATTGASILAASALLAGPAPLEAPADGPAEMAGASEVPATDVTRSTGPCYSILPVRPQVVGDQQTLGGPPAVCHAAEDPVVLPPAGTTSR